MKRLLITLTAALAVAAGAMAGPREDGIDTVNRRPMPKRERDALEWLYRYMPLPDVTAHTPQFFIDNVRVTFAAADSLQWNVPEREFRHFVLPLRVNNEALDSSRTVLFAALLPRVKGLCMADAILEVNHWCHEHATYRPSDPRTSTPLETMSNAVGRCGEESTFTVAALRAVGIPARQVYTPRWAHTDDNHAWVEAWADGRWHFLGACEPEPVLDLAWFNEPASRGMLMNTKVTGPYDGPEEVLAVTPLTTEINVTDNYAPTGIVDVTVLGPDGKPAEGADVTFCLYNYAEYFPLTRRTADASGRASLRCGMGDVVVWATDGTRYAIGSARPGKPLTLTLDITPTTERTFEFDLAAPPARPNVPAVPAALTELNNRRKAAEDSIRAAYTSTFITPGEARALAAELGLDPDRLAAVMADSRGNHRNLAEALRSLDPGRRTALLELLEALPEKDRGDLRRDVIDDVMASTPDDTSWPRDVYIAYILNPRVAWEPLSASRAALQGMLADNRSKYSENPVLLADMLRDFINVNPAENPHGQPMRPDNALQWGVTDRASLNRLFVSALRACGAPARIEPVTGKTQWMSRDGAWHDVSFDAPAETDAAATASANAAPASLTLEADEPLKYFLHFTLARIDGGRPVTMDFNDFESIATVNEAFRSLDPGQYMLTTGQRMADGSVLVRSEIFMVAPGEDARHRIVRRHNPEEIEVIGNFNSENMYQRLGADAPQSLLSTTGRGFYVLGLIAPGEEPSAHTLNDIAAAKAELEATGRPIVLLFADADAAGRFDASLFPAMPSTVTMGHDIDGAILGEIVADRRLASPKLPVFIIADTFNRIVYATQGYTIGLGAKLASLLNRLAAPRD